jgi:hypothetical protein
MNWEGSGRQWSWPNRGTLPGTAVENTKNFRAAREKNTIKNTSGHGTKRLARASNNLPDLTRCPDKNSNRACRELMSGVVQLNQPAW